MHVPDVVSRLREFGEAESVDLRDGNVVFHLTCELDSFKQLEEMTEMIDNIQPENVELTGTRREALIVVEVDSDDFSTIPPYLYEGWKDSDDQI